MLSRFVAHSCSVVSDNSEALFELDLSSHLTCHSHGIFLISFAFGSLRLQQLRVCRINALNLTISSTRLLESIKRATAIMPYQPGDWLAQAALASGRNETSEVVGRKKCRSHRQRSDSGTQNDGRFSDIDMREMRDSKLGRRRYRRWANDNILRELAPALTAADIGSLFAPPPWGDKSVQSPLEIVMASSSDMAAWEPFRNIDMDLQAKVLQQGLHRKAVGSVGEGRQYSAMKAWCGVERNLRSALRRNYTSSFLQEFEEKLAHFIEGDGQDLVLAVGSAYDRLLVHGSSQFHGLKSLTVEVPVDSSGAELETCALIRKTENTPSSMAFNLPEFLMKIKHKDSAAAA